MLTIEVTEQDILLARLEVDSGKEAARCCPIAQSLRRQKIRFTEVNRLTIGWLYDRATVLLPDEAREFIKAFDNGESVLPITFTVGI